MRICHNNYNEIITLENLFLAWEGFAKGKRSKADVINFERNLEDNIFSLHKELKDKVYQHGNYQEFYVRDPKIRHIHKACVRDRVVHHLTSKILEQVFDPTFYPHSYSCRKGKGTHKAVQAFTKMAQGELDEANKAKGRALIETQEYKGKFKNCQKDKGKFDPTPQIILSLAIQYIGNIIRRKGGDQYEQHLP